MTLRLAVLVSHPIQHFAPWHREVAKLKDIDLHVFFYSDLGVTSFFDPAFESHFAWDIPLLDGYDHEFLKIASRPKRLDFWEVDNPDVARALDRFDPDVVKVFGYAHRTTWRVARWTREKKKPLLLYSDSNARTPIPTWRRYTKSVVVRYFYNHVDGALFVGDNNRDYHRRFGLPPERLFAGSLPVDQGQLLKTVQQRELIRSAVRAQHGIPSNAFVVLFCGKFSAHKRPLDLVIAAHAAAKKGFPVWSLLVGEGSERSKIERFCISKSVGQSILTGFVNQSKIPEYYMAADAIAVTSSLDNHPLVISEAATFGLPAIISDQLGCIGPNDTARADFNALVYPCGDTEKLREAIQQLSSDTELYNRMSTAALQMARSQDVEVAASSLASAALELHRLGPRN